MDASNLREWIAIFQMNLVPDGQGGSRESVPPGLEADTPAEVLIQSGGQVAPDDQLADRVRYKVTVRYQAWVTTTYRVMWRDQYLDITATNNEDALDKWLVISCERREAGAQ